MDLSDRLKTARPGGRLSRGTESESVRRRCRPLPALADDGETRSGRFLISRWRRPGDGGRGGEIYLRGGGGCRPGQLGSLLMPARAADRCRLLLIAARQKIPTYQQYRPIHAPDTGNRAELPVFPGSQRYVLRQLVTFCVVSFADNEYCVTACRLCNLM